MRKVNTIIVGQGLAGTLLAFQLYKAGKTFLVIDENRALTASKIAAGMFTPISGKRMVKSKYVDEQWAVAKRIYTEIEQLLNVQLLNEMLIHNVFSSTKEQNDFSLKADDLSFIQHVNTQSQPLSNLHEPFGSFEVNNSGWVNTAVLIEQFKQWLNNTDAYFEEQFDYASLVMNNAKVVYKQTEADQLVFCQGWRAIDNPLFTNMPFNLCKGDVLTIECKGLSKGHIIKKGIYLVHLYDDVYKVGATYNWNNLNEDTDETGLQQLTGKLDELLAVPYKVLSHQAGIRPTTRTREPFIAAHPQFKNIWMLNGLGTKGVLIAPELSEKMLAKLTL